MSFYSTRNAVLLSVTQVGVIVFGILGLAASRKLIEAGGARVPAISQFLMDYGAALLALPLLWIVAAVKAEKSRNLSDEWKALVFHSGTALLLALLCLIGYGVAQPWFHLDWGAKIREKNQAEM